MVVNMVSPIKLLKLSSLAATQHSGSISGICRVHLDFRQVCCNPTKLCLQSEFGDVIYAEIFGVPGSQGKPARSVPCFFLDGGSLFM